MEYLLVGSTVPSVFLSDFAGRWTAPRGDDTRTLMLPSLMANLINIGVGYVLILGSSGFSILETKGTDITIFLSRFVGALWIVLALLRKQSPLRLRFSAGVRPDGNLLREVLAIETPASGESGLYYVGRLLLQIRMAYRSTVSIAANQIVLSLHQHAVLLPNAVAMAAYSIVGTEPLEEIKKMRPCLCPYWYSVPVDLLCNLRASAGICPQPCTLILPRASNCPHSCF